MCGQKVQHPLGEVPSGILEDMASVILCCYHTIHFPSHSISPKALCYMFHMFIRNWYCILIYFFNLSGSVSYLFTDFIHMKSSLIHDFFFITNLDNKSDVLKYDAAVQLCVQLERDVLTVL